MDQPYETDSTLECVCESLRKAGIVTLFFQISSSKDDDRVDDVLGLDQDDKMMDVQTMYQAVSDDDLLNLTLEEHGDQYGQWELDVAAKRLAWVGEEYPFEEEEEDELYDEDDVYEDEEDEPYDEADAYEDEEEDE
jgi:hypothetical protein